MLCDTLYLLEVTTTLIMNSHGDELVLMRKLFSIDEKKLLEYLEYVPIKEKHLCVDSPVIYYMMTASGPQLESMMAILVRIITGKKMDGHFKDYYNELDKNRIFRIQKVITKEYDIVLQPFSCDYPFWWQDYSSRLKHHVHEELEKATLENLLNMHAALFILHCMAGLLSNKTLISQRGLDKLLDMANYIDLEDHIKNRIPKPMFELRAANYTDPSQRLAAQNLMRQATGIESAIFDYVMVLDPGLLGGFQEGPIGPHY